MRRASPLLVANPDYVDMLRVPLTTVSWSRSEMGREAAQLLLRLIEGKQGRKAEHIVLQPELIVRSSCGAKPSARTGVRSAARSGVHTASG